MQRISYVFLAALMIMASASNVFAIDDYFFPTDVLKQKMVGITAGYDFEYAASQNDYPGGHYDDSLAGHFLNLDCQVGLGYGLQTGIALGATPSVRVVNDNYTTSPGIKLVYNHSGVENPFFSLKYSPVELLSLSKDIGVTIEYSFKPGKWGSSHVAGYGYDTHIVEAYGSLATGAFRTFLGWESEINDAANYRMANLNAIGLGTEYNINKSLAATVGGRAGIVGSSTTTGEHRFANIKTTVQYAIVNNVWVVPSFDYIYVENFRAVDQTIGNTNAEIYGLALRAIF